MKHKGIVIVLVVFIVGGILGGISVTLLTTDQPGVNAASAENIERVVVGESDDAPVKEVTRTINATIPADDSDNTNNITVSMEVTRPLSTNPVFDYDANDPVLFRGDFKDTPEIHVLLVDLAGPTIFSSVTSTDEPVPVSGENWKPLIAASARAQGTRSMKSSVDSVVRIGTRQFIAYSDDRAYRLFTQEEHPLPFALDDPGVYFDGEKYHMYYESGNKTGPSGTKIGHATSPNGLTDWNKQPSVYTMKGAFESGDYAMIEQNGVYFLFGDRTTDHPRYNVSVWVNDDPGSGFTRIGNVLTPVETERGIQDVTVQRNERTGKLTIYTQVQKPNGNELHYAIGEINITKNK